MTYDTNIIIISSCSEMLIDRSRHLNVLWSYCFLDRHNVIAFSWSYPRPKVNFCEKSHLPPFYFFIFVSFQVSFQFLFSFRFWFLFQFQFRFRFLVPILVLISVPIFSQESKMNKIIFCANFGVAVEHLNLACKNYTMNIPTYIIQI